MTKYKIWLLYTISILIILPLSGCLWVGTLDYSKDTEIACKERPITADINEPCPYYDEVSDESLLAIYPVVSELLAMPTPMPHSTIAIGNFHLLVILDGSLWAWGHNWQGQLGDGTTDGRARPVQIGTCTDWASVVVGGGHTVALKSDGSLWAWGYNWHGQRGDGTTENSDKPVQIGTYTGWVSVFAGDSHTMAIKADGTLWAWGRNNSGQLGNGTTEDSLVPTQIESGISWVGAMLEAMYTLALGSDGSLWFWGSDAHITFGDTPPCFERSSSPTQVHDRPVRIGGYDDWIRMMAERERNWQSEFVINDDGSLWARGYNSTGQLGDGTMICRDTFVQIGMDTDWTNVVSNGSTTIGIKTDGSVWAWGWGGQRTQCCERGIILELSLIGDGGNEDRHSPVKIIEGSQIPLPVTP